MDYELDVFTVIMNPEKEITDPIVKRCLERDRELFSSFRIYTPEDGIVQEALGYFKEYIDYITALFPGENLTRWISDMVRLYILYKSTWRTLYLDWDIYIRSTDELAKTCRSSRNWTAGSNWYAVWSNGGEEKIRNLVNYFTKRLPDCTRKLLECVKERREKYSDLPEVARKKIELTALDDWSYMVEHGIGPETHMALVDLGPIGEHYTRFKWSPASFGIYDGWKLILHIRDSISGDMGLANEAGKKTKERHLFIVPESGKDVPYIMGWKGVFDSEEDCIEYIKKNSKNEVVMYG